MTKQSFAYCFLFFIFVLCITPAFAQSSTDYSALSFDQLIFTLQQKEATYDSFMTTMTIFIAIFTVIMTLLAGVGWLVSYNDIHSIRREVREELKQHFQGEIRKIAEEVIKANIGQDPAKMVSKLDGLERYVQDLKEDIELKTKKSLLEGYPEDKSKFEKGEDNKNIFD